MSWYKVGRVAVTNGSTTVLGANTRWSGKLKAGDIFTLDGSRLYEIVSFDDERLTLAVPFAGTTSESLPYGIIQNFTATITADLATRTSNMIQLYEAALDAPEEALSASQAARASEEAAAEHARSAAQAVVDVQQAVEVEADRAQAVEQSLAAQINAKAPLGSDGKVPAAHLPSYVDDVLEYTSTANFPGTGETGKIYVATASNRTYRWSGSGYVEISASPGSTDAVPEGAVNLYHTTARAAAAAPIQSVAGRTGIITLSRADVGLGNVDNTGDAAKAVASAAKLTVARTITLTGAATGSVTTDLSGAVNIAVAVDPAGHVHASATTTAAGLLSAADKQKLDGVTAGANAYTHPASHPPSVIAQDPDNRFVTDAEKAAWNAKASTALATPTVAGLMSPADKNTIASVPIMISDAGLGIGFDQAGFRYDVPPESADFWREHLGALTWVEAGGKIVDGGLGIGGLGPILFGMQIGMGDINHLSTSQKGSLVAAINSLRSEMMGLDQKNAWFHENGSGAAFDMASMAFEDNGSGIGNVSWGSIGGKWMPDGGSGAGGMIMGLFGLQLSIGDVDQLTTDAKTVVGAINELNGLTGAPAGMVQMFAGAAAPSGWLLCDGAAVSRSTYAALFAVIGTAYGAGNGSTTFNLPDLRDRTPVGVSAGKTRGAKGGSGTVTIGAGNLPAHEHGVTIPLSTEEGMSPTPIGGINYLGGIRVSDDGAAMDWHTHGPYTTTFASGASLYGTALGSGSATPLDVTNPHLALHFIIKT